MEIRPAHLYLREGEGGGAIVPLPPLALPEEIELLGERWLRKQEFHVTAAHIETIAEFDAEGRGLEIEAASELARDAVTAAAWDYEVGPIAIGDDLRVVREGEARTIVVMVAAPDLERLHARLGEELGVTLPPPPFHTTIYTGPEDRHGIGLHTAQQLTELTEEITGAELAQLQDALERAFRPSSPAR